MPNRPAIAPYPGRRLILASQSPRRAELLREAGFSFEQMAPPYADPDQPEDETLDAEAHAIELALAKARSLAGAMRGTFGGEGRGQFRGLILAADTLCVDQNDRLIGKPKDREHAREMLAGFANRDHAVVSGVALLDTATWTEDGSGQGDGPVVFADRAVVSFGDVSDSAIDFYLDQNQWQGKAGGYNLFDRQAAGWPIRVSGDPATVVGLPMKRLMEYLRAGTPGPGR